MKIVILDGYTLNPGDLSWQELQQIGEVEVYDRTMASQIMERAQDAEIILTNKTPLHAEILHKLPKLRYIGVLATGYDVVDIKAAGDQGVIVTNVPSYGTDSVAQFVFALLLELCHHAGLHSEAVHKGEWARSKDWCFSHTPLVEISGKTMGIIGFGRIGRRTAQIASAFGMNIVAWGRSQKETQLQNFRWVDLEEALSISDVISLHCPSTPETAGMINKKSLSLMKRTAFIINTARGKLVIDEDLAEALHRKVIAGAGLDVLSIEPPSSDNPLFGAPNCVITPHMAWASKEARSRLLNSAVANLKSYVEGKAINTIKV